MNPKFDKLKTLLKELFQLDQPDLDFGLYRIMHAKSAEVTQFLDVDLLPQVKEAFGLYKTADKADLEQQLQKLMAGIEAAGMDPEQSPKVKELRDTLANEAVDIGGLENEVYDHLFSFFRRYYSEGDFLAKRVYRPGVYAIPYEGEEVKLHWANRDQYYIKTSEYLRDYAFRLRPDDAAKPMRVHFRLADVAEGEHGNVKAAEGKERVFILAETDFIAVEDGDLVLRFAYRPATLIDWPEAERDGKKKPPTQKDLSAQAVARIFAVNDAALADWIAELAKPHVTIHGETPGHSRLEGHLNRYTKRNTFDYFIHKDLGGFLRRELDFYVKNEVMHLDDIESDTAPRVEQYLSKIKVIRRIAGKVIDFLAQLEDFQKKLWLKKKFVVETQYCITLDRIPEDFYPEIAANDAQREEWVRLFAIDLINSDMMTECYSAPLTLKFLKQNSSLPIDTAFFDQSFNDRLIQSINEIDGSISGVLIHGENQQAIKLASLRYQDRVKCVYLDPPYNTSEETFVYKNSYRHSSWLSMIAGRVGDVAHTMKDDAILMVTIDDEEEYRLRSLLDNIFGSDRYIGTVVVQSNPRGRGINSFFATSHEYCICYAMNPSMAKIVDQPLTDEQAGGFRHSEGDVKFRLLPFRRSGGLSTPDDRPNSEFSIYFSKSEKKIIGVGGARIHAYPAEYEPSEIWTYASDGLEILRVPVESFLSDAPADTITIMPISSDGGRRVWRWSDRAKILEAARASEFVVQVGGERPSIQLKDHIKEGRKPKTVWVDPRYDASSHGTNLLISMLGERKSFGYPKSLFATRDALHSVVGDDLEAVVVDLFGGSGTTAHAVIDLNREDGGQRKFLLVEAESYFDSVLRPRILKAGYSSQWRDGNPVSRDAGMSQFVKYQRLESYEDALNNLAPSRTAKQADLLALPVAQGADGLKEQYMLRYMLDVETRGSQSLLNVQAFADPTAYKLKVKRPGSDESREVNVDLLETFNWLVGLTVQSIAAPQVFAAEFARDPEGRLELKGRLRQDAAAPWWFRTVTGATPDGRRTLIIWRKLTGDAEQDNLVLDEWFKRAGYSAKDSEFDLIYVNGDNNLENLKAADDTWKVRLIEEDFHRLMFDTEGL